MAAGPSLHIFPPIEEVNRRRESLDDLIRRSMDMRPTGPWPLRTDSNSPIARSRLGKSRTNGGQSPSEVKVDATITESPVEDQPTTTTQQAVPPPMIPPPMGPPPMGPPRQRENPFQALPPIQVPKRNPSSGYNRPRRSSSVTERSRRTAPAANVAQRRAQSPSFAYRHRESPITPESDYRLITPASSISKTSSPMSPPERNASSRLSNRRRVVIPSGGEGGEVASIFSSGGGPIERRVSSRASNRSPASQRPIQRQVSSRASHRTKVSFPASPDRRRAPTPAMSDVMSVVSGSPTLVRSNSSATQSKWFPKGRDDRAPIQSMFPVYDPRLPLHEQKYRPVGVAPIAMISPEKVSKPEYSPTFGKEIEAKKEETYITPVVDLQALWNATNGSMSTPDPKNYTLKMFRPTVSDKKKQKIIFGPSETRAFYSLSKSHPQTGDEEEDHDHELLISRHHASKEDILPVSHIHLQPPPAPTISRSSRASILSDIHVPASHITTITPIMATLHSLDHAAKTPQAHTLALVDPNATSPAAARLAERAVAEATARESCTLAWTPTCPRTGKYELHHPSLGVFSIVTEGDVASAFEREVVKGPTSISIINPFASLTPLSTTSSSPVGSSPSSSSKTNIHDMERDGAVIARLDLQEGVLHIDAASIQQLGNLYLIDVCVSAILSVAVAEAKRPEDPGLVFAAPPPSLLNVKATSKKTKVKEPKKSKKSKKRPKSLGMGIEHLADEEDLPKITKGVLSVLGFSFKTAMWMLGMGLKVTASMVISISRMATKE